MMSWSMPKSNNPIVESLNKCNKSKRDAFIKDYLSHGASRFSFVQIGAQRAGVDSFREDILNDPKWEGILVEPLPKCFKELVNSYKNRPGLKFENAAMAPKNDIFTFYVGPQKTVSTLSKELLVKVKEEIRVEGITWSKLLKKHKYDFIDLVHIDAEGSDCKIVCDILGSDNPPVFIEFEVNRLTSDEEAKDTFLKLEKRGYTLFHRSEKGG